MVVSIISYSFLLSSECAYSLSFLRSIYISGDFQILLPDTQKSHSQGTMAEESKSLQYTPTWVIAAVCFVIVLASIFAERGLHKLGKVCYIFPMVSFTLELGDILV